MMIYGGAKAIPYQFPPPRFTRLIEPYGESSPMGLLWTLMGSSQSYTMITGFVELLAGVLLIVPRTAMLGAIVALGAMTQVFILNMCYDVSVKLRSFHLLVMSLFLLLHNLRRIANLFLFNRPVPAAAGTQLFKRRGLNRAAILFQILFGLAVLGAGLHQGYQGYTTSGAGAPKPPFYGIWSVDEMAVNGELRPPLLTDQSRWRWVIFQRTGSLIVQPMNGRAQVYKLDLDTEGKKMILARADNPESKAEFLFQEPESGLMSLEGQLEGKPAK